ncbi:MAG: formyltransferase family protein [Pseudomonadota bacterium]
MKLGFVTCVQLGLDCMEEIYAQGHTLEVVVTLKDDIAPAKSGRVYVDAFCEHHGIDVVKVRNINDDDALAALARFDLDWLFIIGWSQIARDAVLNSPRLGCIGAHPTLLPRGRGRAAIPWAIIKGLDRTGVTLFKLDGGVDTGPVITQIPIDLDPDETATTLYPRVADAHREAIRTLTTCFDNDTLVLTEQDDAQATTWPGRRPEDGRLSPEMTCLEADRLIRAVTHPYPGAFVERDGRLLVVWSAAVPGASDDAGRPRIACRDGELVATDYEWRDA